MDEGMKSLLSQLFWQKVIYRMDVEERRPFFIATNRRIARKFTIAFAVAEATKREFSAARGFALKHVRLIGARKRGILVHFVRPL